MYCVVSLMGLAWFMVLLTAVLLFVGYDIIPIVFERLPLDIQDNKFSLRGLSWQQRLEDDAVYEVSRRWLILATASRGRRCL